MAIILEPVVKLGELTDAVQSFQQSLELAKLLNEEDSEQAIQKALEEVNAQIVNDLQQPQQTEEEHKSSSEVIVQSS